MVKIQFDSGGVVIIRDGLIQARSPTLTAILDTEMSSLIQLQNAYAANAHVMSVVQNMMNTLIQAQI